MPRTLGMPGMDKTTTKYELKKNSRNKRRRNKQNRNIIII